jgi:hypothetical protein
MAMGQVWAFRWEPLPDELKVRVAKFLPCLERARIAIVSKSVKTACDRATMVYPHISHAIMPEALGRPFFIILNMLRYGVYVLGLAGKLSPQAQRILAEGPNVHKLLQMCMHEDVISLNANVFSYWVSDFSARPDSGVFEFLKETGKLNPHMKLEQDLPQVTHWPHSRAHGTFFVLLERSDGTVVVSEDSDKVYLTQGILSSIGKLLQSGGHKFPMPAMATFLPFHGYVAFDGLVVGSPAVVSDSMRKKLYRAYTEAVDDGTLITSLPLIPPLPRAAAPVEVPALSSSQAQMLQRLKALPKPADPLKGICWVFRRFGYTELENPYHMITIIGSDGLPVLDGFATLRGLHPTALELFGLLCRTLFGAGGGGTGNDGHAQSLALYSYTVTVLHNRESASLSWHHPDRRMLRPSPTAGAIAASRHPGALLPAAHP